MVTNLSSPITDPASDAQSASDGRRGDNSGQLRQVD